MTAGRTVANPLRLFMRRRSGRRHGTPFAKRPTDVLIGTDDGPITSGSSEPQPDTSIPDYDRYPISDAGLLVEPLTNIIGFVMNT